MCLCNKKSLIQDYFLLSSPKLKWAFFETEDRVYEDWVSFCQMHDCPRTSIQRREDSYQPPKSTNFRPCDDFPTCKHSGVTLRATSNRSFKIMCLRTTLFRIGGAFKMMTIYVTIHKCIVCPALWCEKCSSLVAAVLVKSWMGGVIQDIFTMPTGGVFGKQVTVEVVGIQLPIAVRTRAWNRKKMEMDTLIDEITMPQKHFSQD